MSDGAILSTPAFCPCLAEQLKWSRFVNVHGLPGHNISCDLHIEHLNRLAKTAISGLGANKSEKAIIRAGKTVGALSSAMDNLDKKLLLPTTSGSHSTRSVTKVLKEIVNILQQQHVFQKAQGRKHKSFKNLKTNLIRTIDEHNLKEWMTEHFARMVSNNKLHSYIKHKCTHILVTLSTYTLFFTYITA